MSPQERKVYAAHEKHAFTLAFLVFGAFAVIVYFLGNWLQKQHSGWAEAANYVLYIVSFFAIFALSAVKDWFLYRLYKPGDPS